MKFGEAIVEARIRRGMNQRALAKACDISPTTLCNIETGKSLPNSSTIEALTKALDIKPSYLLIAALTKEDVEEGKWEMVKMMKDYLLTPRQI